MRLINEILLFVCIRKCDLLKCSWILLRMFMLILLSTMLIASPLLPNRPVRPILCRYVSLSGLPSLSTGKSKLITTETCSTSIPKCKWGERLNITKKNNVHDNKIFVFYCSLCTQCIFHSGAKCISFE